MSELLSFLEFGGDKNKPHAFAGHLADRLSALEQNLNAARREGDVDLMDKIKDKISAIRSEASEAGLSRNDHPGLYR